MVTRSLCLVSKYTVRLACNQNADIFDDFWQRREQTYLMYFKGAFAEKHGNSGVLARFVLFLFSIRHETKYGM